jgi:N,N'-diacetyllegionaminate synthase
MKPPYLLFEPANFHGGNAPLLMEAIKSFGRIDYKPRGIKFQIFKFDRIALPDFSWYPVFEKVFFDEATWDSILSEARTCIGDVWIDIFDSYGVETLARHLSMVAGIKLQASVLENHDIITGLKSLDLSGKRLLLNISGHDLSSIERFLADFQGATSAKIALQIGYQAYPTQIEDTALQKIGTLRAAFPALPLCFADHAPGHEPMARRIPLLAASLGCELIEKHICLDRAHTEYDHYSALEPAEMQDLARELTLTASAFHGGFLPEAERAYLDKSIQIPVARTDLPAGSLIADSDVIYRRTAQKGLTFQTIRTMQTTGHNVLKEKVAQGAPLVTNSFRKGSIGAIVACRMKSSRLPKKALAKIAGKPSVERCLEACLALPHVDQVVLATSTVEEDRVLENHTLLGRVGFWRGDPDDVILRFLGACDKFGIDVIVRVTADCPAPCPEIAEILIDSHFSSGADYTAPNEYAVGSHVEIYNAEALRRILRLLGKAEHSEFMTWYMRNNHHVFKVNIVDLPTELVHNYRLTLDYPEDLEMFNRLYTELEKQNLPVNADNVFTVLDNNPDIASINAHLTLQYRSDPALIAKLDRVTKIRL